MCCSHRERAQIRLHSTLLKLQSNDLLYVLSLTKTQVKVMEGSRVIDRVSAAEATRLAMLREYEGVGTEHRVRIMRLSASEMRRELPWQATYRTQGAPAIGPWAGGSPEWHQAYETRPRAQA